MQSTREKIKLKSLVSRILDLLRRRPSGGMSATVFWATVTGVHRERRGVVRDAGDAACSPASVYITCQVTTSHCWKAHLGLLQTCFWGNNSIF